MAMAVPYSLCSTTVNLISTAWQQPHSFPKTRQVVGKLCKVEQEHIFSTFYNNKAGLSNFFRAIFRIEIV